MAQFLVIHAFDPKILTTEAQMSSTKAALDAFTADTYCITTWLSAGAGKMACLWEAPSEQAVIDAVSKMPFPVDGIYPTAVLDWAEMKKVLGG